jgi:hypothetical protein
MNKQKLTTVTNELVAAGAETTEANDLSRLALALGHLETTEGKMPATTRPAIKRRWQVRLLPTMLTGLAGVALGMLLVMLAQTSLPGSTFYPIKRASERVAVSVQPSYRGTIMMRRAQEVQALVSQQAAPGLVMNALADYQADAQSYKTPSADYSLFEFCKSSLRQAEARATTPERQAIQQTLTTLRDS